MSILQKNLATKIDPELPWAGDVLDRQKIGAYLTPIIGSIRQPFVISLSAPFGTGKTFFIKCWKQSLENDGYRVVYFNAWETDFSQDPFAAFISSVKQTFSDESGDKGKVIKERITDLAKRTGDLIRPKLLSLVAKGLARKAIGSDTLDEVAEEWGGSGEEIENLLGEIAEATLQAQAQAESSVASFRQYLADIVRSLTEDEVDEAKKKIIVFVDELDRCRPSYAVDLLESIKHFFAVEGVVFLIAVDGNQLRRAISSIYGSHVSGEDYLKKFIDWQISLPEPSAKNFARFLCDRFSLSELKIFSGKDDLYDLKALSKGFGIFASALCLTLREQEQCFTQINLSVRALSEKDNVCPLAIALGCFAATNTKSR